jgi:pyrimidine operon attenuation protein / uracil phosphoribosyltransferase
MKQVVVMDRDAFLTTLDRLASEIVARTRSSSSAHSFEGRLYIVGIRTRGVPLARRLADAVRDKTGSPPSFGILDITLYRDDLTAVAQQPILRKTELPSAVDGAWVVLVDDVLFTGRTVRAAITALIDFGRPRKIELLVMVDRGWRELPIHPDYVGRTVETTKTQTVKVLVSEEDGRDEVILEENGSSR